MDETRWLTKNNLVEMMNYLTERTTPRKLILFGCACCRQSEELMGEPHCSEIIGRLEQFADGEISSQRLTMMLNSQFPLRDFPPSEFFVSGVVEIIRNPWSGALHLSAAAMRSDTADSNIDAIGCNLLRDVIGNPFRPSPLDSAIVSRIDPAAIILARSMYTNRAFSHLPYLGDALEEAGCADTAILKHLREPGMHVRGCWVLDSVLRRE
jgi:hypothetical protein